MALLGNRRIEDFLCERSVVDCRASTIAPTICAISASACLRFLALDRPGASFARMSTKDSKTFPEGSSSRTSLASGIGTERREQASLPGSIAMGLGQVLLDDSARAAPRDMRASAAHLSEARAMVRLQASAARSSFRPKVTVKPAVRQAGRLHEIGDADPVKAVSRGTACPQPRRCVPGWQLPAPC